MDVCAGEDDSVDENDDGEPDCLVNEKSCDYEERSFDVRQLKVKNGTTSTSLEFDPPVSNPKFIVYNIGKKKGKFDDKVTVTYTKSDGTTSDPLVMKKSQLKVLNRDVPKGPSKNDWVVDIAAEEISSLTVMLENDVIGVSGIERKKAKVLLDNIEVCV